MFHILQIPNCKFLVSKIMIFSNVWQHSLFALGVGLGQGFPTRITPTLWKFDLGRVGLESIPRIWVKKIQSMYIKERCLSVCLSVCLDLEPKLLEGF